jgi:hypothetical protein
MRTKILPCPFCGRLPKIGTNFGDDAFVRCENRRCTADVKCGAVAVEADPIGMKSNQFLVARKLAIQRWNTRR